VKKLTNFNKKKTKQLDSLECVLMSSSVCFHIVLSVCVCCLFVIVVCHTLLSMKFRWEYIPLVAVKKYYGFFVLHVTLSNVSSTSVSGLKTWNVLKSRVLIMFIPHRLQSCHIYRKQHNTE
jgi:hypothetical protein